MNIYTDLNHLPQFNKAVLTIGTFDGVHLGHAKIIEQVITEAKAINGTCVLITFYPHPRRIIASEKNTVFILNTQEEKYRLLEKKGISNVVVVPFNKDFSEQSAAAYIQDFLVDKFQPHSIIIGYDHRFGKGREGNFQLLEASSAKLGFKVIEIPEHILENITISSTKIRDALLDGDLDIATSYLGYHYLFSGYVIEGNKLGRTIGYPTANLQPEEEQKLIPANGVYAVDVKLEDDVRKLKGMMNIGFRPTVNGSKRNIEVNIFDFNETIYGKKLTVSLKQRLRDEVKFNSLNELKEQLAYDEKNARIYNP